MSQRITIEIKDKIATCLTELPVVCGNADYVVDFVFDEEWNKHYVKTAVFVVNGKAVDQVFEGNTCPVPAIQNTLITQVGVFAGTVNDGTLSTSTPALVKCIPCITDGNNVPLPPPDDVYNQIIDLINKYIDGGSGEIDIRNLQTKVDEALQTYSKEVVGAINELNTIANRADENSQNGTLALEKATTAEENASAARKKAESAEEKVDALDEIAASSLQLASQSFALATEAKTNSEKSVEKTELPNQLYGTDADGNPALYPTDSVGTSVFVDGQKVKEFNADEKFDKTGGVIGGDVSIQGNFSVSGTTTTKDTETLRVKDNVIVANADGIPLVDNSGFAIKTNETDAYGIMYDPIGDGVKIGLGGFTEGGKFVYNEGEAQFLATRADNITDGNIPKWDNDKKQFVDSGEKIGDYVKKPTSTSAYSRIIGINNKNVQEFYPVMYPNYKYDSTGALSRSGIPYMQQGQLPCAVPTSDYSATNKKYVDDNSTKLYLHEISVDNGAYKFYIVSTYSQAYDMLGLHFAMHSVGEAVNDTYGATVSVYDKKYKTISIDLDETYGVYREYLEVVESSPGSYDGRTLAHEYFAFGNWTDTVTKL
jgi:hypothetical protein